MKKLLIQNLTVGYKGKPIIEDLSIEVKEKEVLVLMGISGSGKTTLLLTILGILNPIEGKVLLKEKDITTLPIEQRNIGYLPQDYGLFPHLNVFDNIAYGLKVRGYSKDKQAEKVAEMLKLTELIGYEEKKVNELSGGQRQRVGLARAIAIEPDLFLLDEPLSNIDQITKFEVSTALKSMFNKLNIPIVLVTHNHEDAIFFNEHVAVMIEGKIIQTGSLKELLKSPKIPFIRKLLMPLEG